MSLLFDPFSQVVLRVLNLAQQEAMQSHDQYIGTKHLLLALMSMQTEVGARALQYLSVETEAVRQTANSFLGRGERPVSKGSIKLTKEGKEVLQLAEKAAQKTGSEYIDTGHLLIVLMRKGAAANVLVPFGLKLSQVRKAIRTMRNNPLSSDESLPLMQRETELTGALPLNPEALAGLLGGLPPPQ